MDLRSQIINFPDQLGIGANAAKLLNFTKPTGPIVIAGMGGSILPGRILQMIMPEVQLHEDYDLPASMPAGALVICISWSGNTEETISAYQKALDLKLDLVAITSGGKLAELANQNSTPMVVLSNDGLQPRRAVGFMAGALFEILGLGSKLVGVSDRASSEEVPGAVANGPLELEQRAQEIAKQIGQKIPLIYTTSQYQSTAYFWKILFNENCKIHAFNNYFPRLDHNELAGFNQQDKEKFFYITFRDETEDPRQNRNLDAALAIMNQIGYNGANVNLSGNTLLDKVLNNYLLGLWTSYYLAQELGVDPSDIKVIEDFKHLKQQS